MANAYTPGIEISEGTLVRRERRLPVKGEVLVHEGDQVQSDTVVARAYLPGELVAVRVAEILGLPPSETAKHLLIKEGSDIEESALIAEASFLWGLLRSEARAPVSGTVEYWSHLTGHLGIRLPAKPIEVDAFVGGSVERVVPEEGAVISSLAALVQGVIGVGPEAQGTVKMLDGADSLDETYSGCIAVYPDCTTKEILHRGKETGLAGLLSASVCDKDLGKFLERPLSVAVTGDEDLPFPVVVTEGFGKLKMSPRALKVAEAVEGRTGSISARTQIRAGAVRPELVVPVDESRETGGEKVSFLLTKGTRVRLIREPNFGRMGKVRDLPPKPLKIETGAVVPVVEVRLDDGGLATVPRANVEVIT